MRRHPLALPGRLLHRTSLRTRLLCLATALVAVGLSATGVIVTTSLHGYLQDRVDERLSLTAQIAARLTPPSGDDATRVAKAVSLLRETSVTYVDDRGTVRRAFDAHATPSGGVPDLPRLDRGAVLAHGGRPFTVASRDGDHAWRVLAVVQPDQRIPAGATATPGSVVVATSLDEVDRTVAKTRGLSLTAGLVLVAVLAVAGRFAVRSGLRPLTRIEEAANRIAAGDLAHRVPELADPRTEVGRLTACLNQMLAQIDTAFQARAEAESRMRRFFADASHELRTPLVGIKGYTDLYRMGALASRGDIDQTMARIAQESERLTRLVEDMLLLARLDEDTVHGPAGNPVFPLDLAPMDLRTLAADALHDLGALDATRPVTLTGPGGGRPGTAPALADEARLRQVVTNLVGNAVAHTPAGTPVRIGVGTADDAAVLEVADRGPGLTEEQRARVFDRFYRADDSRTRALGGGSGLGLAIAHALVAAHGGRIELRTAPGEGCTFRVLLPLLERALAADAHPGDSPPVSGS
ncbi:MULTISPECIES: HAMP domain-containing sensor histidine kinase [Streptomyces]|uniref:histidine kinase n=1 Tax=Streptomyces misionensis TaxID=67331 RepID=A0A1H4NKT4_9ACTN|nr:MULTISPECIES: HAMP domain-containing sensor histidine kinase [Streptomyces]SEB95856.1 two-component system, OmpR family, sensor kinase [Streptomyces misionensis]SFY47473.1 putative sensor histidine kinase TcrY [Streptomyces sp. F-1]